MILQGAEAALEPGPSPARHLRSALRLAGLLCAALPCSALLHSVPLLWPAQVCSTLRWQDISSVSAQPLKPSLQWKGEVHSQSPRGASLYGQKTLLLAPSWSVLVQMTPNHCSFIGPKDVVPIGQNGATLVG